MVRKFNRREQVWLLLGGLAVFCAMAFHLVFVPIQEKTQILERQVAAKTETLARLRPLVAEYQSVAVVRAHNRGGRRETDTTLFAFLEQLAKGTGVARHIDYMRPSLRTDPVSKARYPMVKMKLKGMKTAQMVTYLRGVEAAARPVAIRKLSITREGESVPGISMILQVESTVSQGGQP